MHKEKQKSKQKANKCDQRRSGLCLCICLLFFAIVFHSLCVSLRKRSNNHHKINKQNAQISHIKCTTMEKKHKKQGCVWNVVVHVHFLCVLFAFVLRVFKLLFCVLFAFFGFPLQILCFFVCTIFDKLLFSRLLHAFFCISLLSFLSVVCIYFAFLWILEISELGCKAHHNHSRFQVTVTIPVAATVI